MLFTLRHLFTPHYSNDHRARILHPAGLSVLIALFVLTQSSLQLLRYVPVLPEGFVLGYASNITASQVVDLTNSERSKSGLESLSYNSVLSEAAAQKANHMFSYNYWAHISPDGSTPWEFIRSAGYSYSVAGENLARDFDSSSPMMEAWMNSPTHKENIVNQKYSEIGVAVVDGILQGVETTLVVQMFGTPSTPQIAAVNPTIPEQAAQAEVEPAVEQAVIGESVEDVVVTEELAVEEIEHETIPAELVIQGEEVLRYDNALAVTLNSDRNSIFKSTYL